MASCWAIRIAVGTGSFTSWAIAESFEGVDPFAVGLFAVEVRFVGPAWDIVLLRAT